MAGCKHVSQFLDFVVLPMQSFCSEWVWLPALHREVTVTPTEERNTHRNKHSEVSLQARKNLELVRGTKDVDREFDDLVEYARLAHECKHPWKTLFSKKYRPQLILSACSTGFQQWTG